MYFSYSIIGKLQLLKAQQYLNEGQEPCDVADQLGIKRDTFSKAIRTGRLHNIKKRILSTKSERSGQDNAAPMGMGTRNVDARLAASIGQLEEPVVPDFQALQDVPKGGVLFALPALLVTGLLKYSENFLNSAKAIMD
ncbi:putative transposase [Bathymodiolus platifrons methanotrophic gill symbiont]|uniref:putative transposase n=1 Tax=Bathymodiolus platifrons methanotrophic gill symbiont TaxID=113268 RepID=UPI001C8E818E|nr:hypothetical protein [Bathymodiolus platifrons methanotrophic gill symbiont]